MIRTKGELEAEISRAVVRFQREQQGRGPTDVRVHVNGDLALVRMTGIFTPNEAHLAVTDEGRKLIRSARRELSAIYRPEMEALLTGLVGVAVARSYYDVSVDAAEQVEVYVFASNLEKLWL